MTRLQKKSVILLIVMLLIALLNMFFGNVKKAFNTPANNKVIVIDAGHGGRDAGASGKAGVREKDVNLEIAKKLKRYIGESGGVAVMIREEDNGLYSIDSPNKKKEDMKNRKQIIKDSNADLFLSIHLNSFPQSKYYGAQVFYFEGSKSSQHLARILQEELRRILNRNNDRVEKSTRDYYILKDNGIPSALIECGFLSNPEEEMLLKSPEYQDKIAWTIYIGILRFFSEPVPQSTV
jgi:N-acetylmuramoyl-L-alanine amidase